MQLAEAVGVVDISVATRKERAIAHLPHRF